MEAFPSAADLVSWAGVCPGNNQTAGKRKSGTTRAGNPWLRRALCEGAWAASKGTYLQAQFRRLAALRGPKRALIAVANSILTAGYCCTAPLPTKSSAPITSTNATPLARLIAWSNVSKHSGTKSS